jgi:hypothetical protein
LDQVKAERFSWCGAPGSAGPTVRTTQFPTRIVSALIQEGRALLHNESFDLDLIGFDATELERLLALALGEGPP